MRLLPGGTATQGSRQGVHRNLPVTVDHGLHTFVGQVLHTPDLRDVLLEQHDALVGEWMVRELAVDLAIPPDDLRHELHDLDARGRRERVERGAQREAHAEAADQDARRGRLDVGGALLAKLVLGDVVDAAHQLDARDADRELLAVLREYELLPARRGRAIDDDRRGHVTVYPITPTRATFRACRARWRS